jgi:thioredoxin reductase (NADPH)
LWCDELGLKTLLLEEKSEIGGQLLRVYNPIGNYPGLRARNGREMRDVFAKQIANAKFDLHLQAEIEAVDLRAKRIKLGNGEQLEAASILIATGVRRRRLGIPGEKEFAGRGVMESATRDREQFAGKYVCVVGGGDAAVENALLLAEVCKAVLLVHRGKALRARAEFVKRLHANNRITLFTQFIVRRITGVGKVEAVEISREMTGELLQKAVSGVVVRIGVEPNTELFRGQLQLDARGYVVVTNETQTSANNVFAAGDVANPLAPTISGACGAGATAAKVIAARLQNSRAG